YGVRSPDGPHGANEFLKPRPPALRRNVGGDELVFRPPLSQSHNDAAAAETVQRSQSAREDDRHVEQSIKDAGPQLESRGLRRDVAERLDRVIDDAIRLWPWGARHATVTGTWMGRAKEPLLHPDGRVPQALRLTSDPRDCLWRRVSSPLRQRDTDVHRCPPLDAFDRSMPPIWRGAGGSRPARPFSCVPLLGASEYDRSQRPRTGRVTAQSVGKSRDPRPPCVGGGNAPNHSPSAARGSGPPRRVRAFTQGYDGAPSVGWRRSSVAKGTHDRHPDRAERLSHRLHTGVEGDRRRQPTAAHRARLPPRRRRPR